MVNLMKSLTCESCGARSGEPHKATTRTPGIETLERWMSECVANATDGCRVEPDGKCAHGHRSWLLVMGCI